MDTPLLDLFDARLIALLAGRLGRASAPCGGAERDEYDEARSHALTHRHTR